MGTLKLPTSGLVYVDTMVFIYTVERFAKYVSLLVPLWQAAQTGAIEIVTSELALMETLVAPLKSGNAALVTAFERALLGTAIRLIPVAQPTLREGARLRATTKLRTPDAIHAATALAAGCAIFVTNDVGFRAVPGLSAVILDDLLKP
jgi:predicted nucleic acid-binding protein